MYAKDIFTHHLLKPGYCLTFNRVTAIFAGMNVQFFAYMRLNKQERELTLTKLRASLIALKQFEQCYILARWVRIMWSDLFDRSSRKAKKRQLVSVLNANPNCSSVDDHTQLPFLAEPATDTNDISSPSQMTDTQYFSTGWSDTSPYSSTDWSNLFLSEDCEASSALPLPVLNTLEYDGLQFLANLGFTGYDT